MSSPVLSGLGLVLVEFEYEYEGRDGALVSIKPNERYILLAKTNDHWWQVQMDHISKPFYIPAKYVKELPAEFPSPLDFVDPTCPDVVLPPVVASPIPVPVPVPVPKPLEEPSGTRNKPGDEVTIRLRPDASTRYHKNENRMSTFGVPLDLQDVVLPLRHPGSPPAGPAETVTTATSETTNSADNRKPPPLPGVPEDSLDSGKPRVPSFSPADPRSTSWTQIQPIPVDTPVVPPQNSLTCTSPSPDGCYDNQEEEEEPEVSMEEESSAEEEESPREEDSNHIYESIQDLGLEGLVGGSPESSSAPLAPPTTQVRHLTVLTSCDKETLDLRQKRPNVR